MKQVLFLILLCPLFFVNILAQDTGLTGRQIMLESDNRPDGDDRKSVMHMTLVNKRGRTRERTILSYSRDYGKDRKTIMYFQKPADVKGTGFLSWEYDDPAKDDDRWLYLPALKKVRRISGSSKNDYFMGSDFTYDDMGDRSVDEDTHKLINEEAISGINCWVVESTPVDKTYMYSKVIRWMRKDALVPAKVEYYDRGGELLKILTLPEVRQHQDIWTVFKWVMDNIQEKHRTILELEEIDYNTGVKETMFKVSTLERGRIR